MTSHSWTLRPLVRHNTYYEYYSVLVACYCQLGVSSLDSWAADFHLLALGTWRPGGLMPGERVDNRTIPQSLGMAPNA